MMADKLEITNHYLVIFVLLEDSVKRNITDIVEILDRAYRLSKSSDFKGSRMTITRRLDRLRFTDYLGSEKEDGSRNYWLLKRGIEHIKTVEENDILRSTVQTWRKIFKAVKATET